MQVSTADKMPAVKKRTGVAGSFFVRWGGGVSRFPWRIYAS